MKKLTRKLLRLDEDTDIPYSTQKWLLRRKLDVIFLCIEAVALTVLAYLFVFNMGLFFKLLGIYALIAILVGIGEFVAIEVNKHKHLHQ